MWSSTGIYNGKSALSEKNLCEGYYVILTLRLKKKNICRWVSKPALYFDLREIERHFLWQRIFLSSFCLKKCSSSYTSEGYFGC